MLDSGAMETIPTIRMADSAADFDAARAILNAYTTWLKHAMGLDVCFQGYAEEIAQLPGKYAPPSGALLLAELGGTPVGVLCYYKLREGIAELKRLYVLPEGRGHHLGEALFHEAIARARAAGYREIWLDTLTRMEAAVSMYHRLGFVPILAYNASHEHAPDVLYFGLRL
jgi:GNAT superfamily N-acetyltransferase